MLERHKPELDGVRGIAILAVFLTHCITVSSLLPRTRGASVICYIFTPGWAGVDLFFVLSGFLITGILLRTKDSPNYFKFFYMRRILRIFPLYYTFITVVFIAQGLHPDPNGLAPKGFLSHASYYLYLQNLGFMRSNGFDGRVVGHFWSLAVEEQFYIIWPFLVFSVSRKTLMKVCVVGFIVALPLRIVFMHYIYGLNIPLMWLTTSRADGLFAGSACAIYMHHTRRLVPLWWIALAAGAGLSILLFIILKTHGDELIATGKYMQTIGVTSFSLLSGALVAVSGYRFRYLQHVLTWAWLRALGRYSYGMYVFHIVVLLSVNSLLRHVHADHLSVTQALAAMALMAFITFLVAKASYDYYEVRFLKLKRYFEAGPRAAAHDVSVAP